MQLTAAIYHTIPRLRAEYAATFYQGATLLTLIEKNILARGVSAAEMSEILKRLVQFEGVKLSQEACYFHHFAELLTHHFETLSDATKVA